MSARYILAPRALSDLEEVWWYSFQFEGSDLRADTVVDGLYETIALLAERPRLGRTRPWLEPDQLAFPSGKYLVIYRPTAEGVEVSRVSGADENLRREH